jgi:asparagine synthetase B (glutamine-hydrolysing)
MKRKKEPPPKTESDRVLSRLRKMTETELHTEIIIPLLQEGIGTHVQYLHGNFEREKDLLFIGTDSFGEPTLEVCQVKNTRFSGSAGSENAVAVLNQLQQCRDLEVLNPRTTLKERPHWVVLISTYDIPDKDLADGKSFLDNLRANRCKFVPPGTLLKLLEKHLPEVYRDFGISWWRHVSRNT